MSGLLLLRQLCLNLPSGYQTVEMRNVLLGGNKERRGEERLIKINVKMSGKKEGCESVNYAHRLLEGTIKLVDQIHGVRRK